MLSSYRSAFNRAFTPERYRVFLDDLQARCGCPIRYRVAETPVFLSAA